MSAEVSAVVRGALWAALRAEWIKLRSVRSTWLALAVAIGLGLGVGLLDVAAVVHDWPGMSGPDRAAFDPVGESFSGFQYGELALGALGVLAISTEYATGLIRGTLVAVPTRRHVFAAKVLVLAAFALVVCEACAFGAFLVAQAVLARRGLGVGLGEPGALRAVACAGLYMAVVTLVGFGLGVAIRHTAGAMTAMVALVFLAWPAARAVEGFSTLPDRLLLVNAADTLTALRPARGPHAERLPSLGLAYLDLALYLVTFLGLAAWRLSRDP